MKKPKILFLIDVHGWAWCIKTDYLIEYLKPFYDIDKIYICFNEKNINIKDDYDLYFTFGFAFTHYLNKVPFNKRISGMTAHRKLNMIKPVMKKVKFHHANSILLINEMKKIEFNPFYVPNGVDTKLFYKKLPLFHKRNNLVVGHVGKKSVNKNQKSFIEPMLESIDDIIYDPHYNDFSNKIPHKDMIYKYQNYDIMIVNSKEDGTPNGMLESMACERPVIINKIGNAPELIRNGINGFMVESNFEDYQEKIKFCRDNPKAVIKMGKQARKDIKKNWEWSILYKNYLYMFDTILGIKRDFYKYHYNNSFSHI